MTRGTRRFLRRILPALVLGTAVVTSFWAAIGRTEFPAGHFVDQGNGTVLDTKTRLLWQQGVSPYQNWANSRAYCENNTPQLPGTGWRVPSLNELVTLLDETTTNASVPRIDNVAFPGTGQISYWSSTLVAGDPSSAWRVSFGGGFVIDNGINAATQVKARCVRLADVQ